MATPISRLQTVFEKITDVPLFLLPVPEQTEYLDEVKNVVTTIQQSLVQKSLADTNINNQLEVINSVLNELPTDEYRLTVELRSLITLLNPPHENEEIQRLIEVLTQIAERSAGFWISEEEIEKNPLDEQTVYELDKELLATQMQIYALDYFMFMFRQMKEGDPKARTALLFSGLNGRPGLIEDALADDMPKKIIYQLKSRSLRHRMIRDYYIYRQTFIGVTQDSLNDGTIGIITEALRQYCMTLVAISLEFGIVKHVNGINFPYGQNVDMSTINHYLAS